MDIVRIDYIDGLEEFDGTLWYFDGTYVGHDDQVEASDFTPAGTSRLIDFHHRTVLGSVDWNTVLNNSETLEALEPFLSQEAPR